MNNDYRDGYTDGYDAGYLKGTHEGFIIGKGEQAKDAKEIFCSTYGSTYGDALEYIKELESLEEQGEKVAKANENNILSIWKRIQNKIHQ